MEAFMGWLLLVLGAFIGYQWRDWVEALKVEKKAKWPSFLARVK